MMLTQGNEEDLGMVHQNNGLEQLKSARLQQLEQDSWYVDIILYLLNPRCPDHLKGNKRRSLRLKSVNYCITQEGLGWRNLGGIIIRYVNEQESNQLLVEFHVGFCGGHYATDTTTHKILRAGYY